MLILFAKPLTIYFADKISNVDDIEETFGHVKENGFDIQENAPVLLNFWKMGCRYFTISGPDGERLEFNQIL